MSVSQALFAAELSGDHSNWPPCLRNGTGFDDAGCFLSGKQQYRQRLLSEIHEASQV